MENFPSYPAAVQEKILNGPAMTPPDGVIPNFVKPSNLNTTALAVAVLCISLAVVAALLRFYSRLIVGKQLHLEDYIALASFACYGGFLWTYFSFYTICGFFVHEWDIQVKTLFDVAYVTIILPITYAAFMLFIKPATLLEWTRIFVPKDQHNTFFWIARMLMLVNVLLYASGIIAESLACIPLEKLWHTWLPGKCIDRRALDSASAAFNLLIDIMILILPQRVIWNLQLKRGRRIGISLVFSIGLLAVASAAGRLYACITQPYGGGDATYNLGRTFLWAMAEMTCVLLVFCTPAIPKAFKNSQPGFLSRLAQSMRSWTRIHKFGSRRKSDGRDESWLPFEEDSLQQQSIATVDMTHLPSADPTQRGIKGSDNIVLVQPVASRSTNNAGFLHGQAQQLTQETGSGIIRNTEVLQKKGSVFYPCPERRSESPYYDHQQLWAHQR